VRRLSHLTLLILFTGVPCWTADALVGVTLPDVATHEGEAFVQAITVEDLTGLEVIAATFEIEYDATLVTATGISTPGTLSQGWFASTRVFEEGRIRIPMASPTPASGAGLFVNVLFEALPGSVGQTSLAVSRAVLNSSPASSVAVGSVVIQPHVAVMEFTYSLVPGWNLVSLPGIADPAALDHVSLGSYIWDAEARAYRSSPAAGDSFAPVTTGMFLTTDVGTTVTIDVDVDDSTVRTVPVVLQQGWNLVGAPWGAATDAPFPVSALTDGSATFSMVYRYDPTTMSYRRAHEMVAGRGYWVFNHTDGPTTVRLTQPRDMSVTAVSSAPKDLDPTWSAHITLTSHDGDRRSVEIGVSEMARAGFDPFDLPTPPPPPARNRPELFVTTRHEGVRLARSVQAPLPGGMEWDVTVRLPNTGGVIARSHDGPRAVWRMHIDSDGRAIDMHEGTTARLEPGTHLLRVRVSPTAPSATRLLPNYPNPFNPETWIPFELGDDADVTVRVYGLDAAIVRTLDLGHRAAGMHSSRDGAAYWDGRNETGERVATGVYVYELRAGNQRALRRMVISK
jgi:hypothetical protein